MRRSPSTTPRRSPYSFRVRLAKSRGVSGVSISVCLLRIQHEREVGGLDAADERGVRFGLELDGALVDERVHVIQGPVAIALDAQSVAEVFVPHAPLEQVAGAGLDRLQDVQLHPQLAGRLCVALRLNQLLNLGSDVCDRLLVSDSR